MSICYLNKGFTDLDQASISPLDRGFLFGDSVYEVFAAYEKKLFRIEDHLERLFLNLQSLRISNPYSRDEIESLVKEVCIKNEERNQIIYLQISRGREKIRNHIPDKNTKPTLFICSFEMSILLTKNRILSSYFKQRYSLEKSSIKSNSLLANVIYKMKANEEGVDELIMSDNGYITEGAVSNIFCVKKDTIFTPPLETNILPGVTRKVILEILNELDFKYEEEAITENFLLSSDELWITNTTKGVVPILKVDGKVLGDGNIGKVYQQVKQEFLKKLRIAKSLIKTCSLVFQKSDLPNLKSLSNFANSVFNSFIKSNFKLSDFFLRLF